MPHYSHPLLQPGHDIPPGYEDMFAGRVDEKQLAVYVELIANNARFIVIKGIENQPQAISNEALVRAAQILAL